jgi:predicted transposase/invertase (TIGR01784 family)
MKAEEESGLNVLPTNDIIFKMIFCDPRHSNVLVSLLNAIIKPASPIKSVKIEGTELPKDALVQKGVRLDISATTDKGELINIEVQLDDQKDMIGRALYYWSRLFSVQLKEAELYRGLRRTISISILGFRLFKDERYWRRSSLRDDETNEKLTELLEVHFIELDKARKVDEKSELTFWLEFLNNLYSEKLADVVKFVPEIQEAKKLYEQAKSDPEAQELLRILEKNTRDRYSQITYAKEEGLAEGKAAGLVEGEAKGETKKARETAVNLLSMGSSVEQISKATGLSQEEIRFLKQ